MSRVFVPGSLDPIVGPFTVGLRLNPQMVVSRRMSAPKQSNGYLGFCLGGGVGPEIFDFGAASRLNPTPGSPVKGPSWGPARFAPIVRPADQF